MANEKPWVIPSDIPEHPTEKLVVTGSGGRRWESAPMPEGFFDGMFPPMPRVADELEPDYEALGYPETRVAQCFDLGAAGEVVDGTMMMLRESLSWGRPMDNE